MNSNGGNDNKKANLSNFFFFKVLKISKMEGHWNLRLPKVLGMLLKNRKHIEKTQSKINAINTKLQTATNRLHALQAKEEINARFLWFLLCSILQHNPASNQSFRAAKLKKKIIKQFPLLHKFTTKILKSIRWKKLLLSYNNNKLELATPYDYKSKFVQQKHFSISKNWRCTATALYCYSIIISNSSNYITQHMYDTWSLNRLPLKGERIK